MRRLILAAALSLALIPQAEAQWDMNKQIDQTNFLVNGSCSGTLIDVKARYILTAQHCIEDQYKIIERERIDGEGVIKEEKVRRVLPGSVRQLYFKGANETHEISYVTKIMATDKEKDLALLKILADDLPPGVVAAKIACAAPRRGDTVFVVGNPYGVLYSSVVKGIVSSVTRDYGTIGVSEVPSVEPLIQVSAGVIGGNSGGAVYNTEGFLVGVPVRANRTQEILGFAVPLDAIKSFLRGNTTTGLFDHCDSK